MKRISTLLPLLALFLFLSASAEAQQVRNPVLEYCTGAWCQWCPCGHTVIRDVLIPQIPNAIVIGYHGPANTSSDPFSTFSGNQVISALGLSSYPTGVADRTSAPISRGSWFSAVFNRTFKAATVDFSIIKTFNATTRDLNVTLNFTPLVNLNGSFKYSLVLTEDSLLSTQTGNSSCTGGANYVNDHVVRAMINGYLGEQVSTGDWNQGTTISKSYTYNVPATFKADKCHLIAFIYKDSTALNLSEIQQAKQWTLIGDILPVELTTFTANVVKGAINLSWTTATELNNYGFEIERSVDGKNFASVGFVKGNGSTSETKNYSFSDKAELNNIKDYYYRLKQVDFNGSFEYSDIIQVAYYIPENYLLEQNYPNPFNPSTIIGYAVPDAGNVCIKVYDILGNEVMTLVNEFKSTGFYTVELNAASLSAGTYIYKMTSGNFSSAKKLSLIK